jgi:hypothetical protein
MIMFALFSVAAVQPLPKPLTSTDTDKARCVAALAIVAHDQARGAPGWTDFPPLARRGAHFAGVIGDRMMRETDRSREQVRDVIIAQVKTLQPQGDAALAGLARRCIAMMDKIDPPLPPPSPAQCAAIMALAYDEARKAGPLDGNAKDLGTLAAVIDYRAREELRTAGKTEADRDHLMAEAKQQVAAMAQRDEIDQDVISHCADLAKR